MNTKVLECTRMIKCQLCAERAFYIVKLRGRFYYYCSKHFQRCVVEEGVKPIEVEVSIIKYAPEATIDDFSFKDEIIIDINKMEV